jgi:hypothetical protein
LFKAALQTLLELLVIAPLGDVLVYLFDLLVGQPTSAVTS